MTSINENTDVSDLLIDNDMENEDTNLESVGEGSEESEVKAKAEILRLCKGQMPMPLVWYIRFHEEGGKSAIAKKYFTTPGKISDIQSSSNQKYIVSNILWTDEDLDLAREQVQANFVRGQADKNPTKRKLATTTAEDAQYSLEVLDIIAKMVDKIVEDSEYEPESYLFYKAAREQYNTSHPRGSKKVKEESKPEELMVDESESEPEELMVDDDDLLDSLIVDDVA